MTDLAEGRREYMREYLRERYHEVVKNDPNMLAKKRAASRETQRRRRQSEAARQLDRDYSRKAREADVVKFLLKGASYRAKSKGLIFDLTDEWARERWTGFCELTGIAFQPSSGGQGTRSPSLDRISPALGYVQSNCRFILSAVNSLKGSGSDEEMFVIAKAICGGITYG